MVSAEPGDFIVSGIRQKLLDGFVRMKEQRNSSEQRGGIIIRGNGSIWLYSEIRISLVFVYCCFPNLSSSSGEVFRITATSADSQRVPAS